MSRNPYWGIKNQKLSHEPGTLFAEQHQTSQKSVEKFLEKPEGNLFLGQIGVLKSIESAQPSEDGYIVYGTVFAPHREIMNLRLDIETDYVGQGSFMNKLVTRMQNRIHNYEPQAYILAYEALPPTTETIQTESSITLA
jgi:hypothetical protein